jgi:predicted LPLAT superfamily acyltransferase
MRWQDVAEKGGVSGVAFFALLATAVGRGAARALLPPVVLWFVLVHGGVRRASGDYLVRVLGRPPRLREIYRHVLTFAQVTLDRLFFAKGDLAPFALTVEGEEHLAQRIAARQGALLLLSHVGSFEVMRGLSRTRTMPVSSIADFRNARFITEVLRRINPEVDARLIPVVESTTFVFTVEARIAAGEVVTTMGDRVGSDGKAVEVEFLGGRARFPTGPYLLASALRCPVLLAFATYEGPNRYHVRTEPFADAIELPRGGRDEALRAWAARYARRLEAVARAAPYNWFNFYDFWSERP